MLPITKKEIEQIIREEKKAGKDTSDLEATLREKSQPRPPRKVGPIEKRIGEYTYVSTGPLTVHDFDKKKKTKKKAK